MSVLKTLVGVVALTSFLSTAANAVPVLWTLDNVTFDDGGTASGSFVFDADDVMYSDIMITTTAGSVLGGATYGDPLSLPGLPVADQLVTVPDDSLADLTGLPVFFPIFVGAGLTNDGGIVQLRTLGNFDESLCLDPDCRGVQSPSSRSVVSGQVIGVAVPIPEPNSFCLALVGFGVFGWVHGRPGRRRGRSPA